jgi:hypothetical protein
MAWLRTTLALFFLYMYIHSVSADIMIQIRNGTNFRVTATEIIFRGTFKNS